MTMPDMSISGASEILERTRRTIKRALRDTEPNSYVRGQPRWKLAVIVDALARNTAPKNGGGWSGDEIPHDWKEQQDRFHRELERERITLPLFEQFNAQLDKM